MSSGYDPHTAQTYDQRVQAMVRQSLANAREYGIGHAFTTLVACLTSYSVDPDARELVARADELARRTGGAR